MNEILVPLSALRQQITVKKQLQRKLRKAIRIIESLIPRLGDGVTDSRVRQQARRFADRESRQRPK